MVEIEFFLDAGAGDEGKEGEEGGGNECDVDLQGGSGEMCLGGLRTYANPYYVCVGLQFAADIGVT